MKYPKYPIPEFDGDYINIYIPKGDTYQGEDTPSFEKGKYYDEWITNDFSIMKDGNVWHIVGITHPRPKGFVNEFDFDISDVHEAEYQLFHCTAIGESFDRVFCENSFKDEEKILYPGERPGEKPELWAPHLMKYNGKYNVIYSPKEMRRMVSVDFANWEKAPTLFECSDPEARDPYIYEEDGKYYCIYFEKDSLKYRVSENMTEWTEPKVLQVPFFNNCFTESPFLFKREGIYYLLWTIYDGRNSCYDYRTLVFAGESLEELFDSAPLTMLKAHAPEVVTDSDGTCYLLSVYCPTNGISAVKLKWI